MFAVAEILNEPVRQIANLAEEDPYWFIAAQAMLAARRLEHERQNSGRG